MVVLVLIRIEYTFFVVSGFNPFLYTILVVSDLTYTNFFEVNICLSFSQQYGYRY